MHDVCQLYTNIAIISCLPEFGPPAYIQVMKKGHGYIKDPKYKKAKKKCFVDFEKIISYGGRHFWEILFYICNLEYVQF